MNPERGPPHSLLSRASIFLLFPSSLPLLLFTSLYIYTSVVCHVLNNVYVLCMVCVCVCIRVCVECSKYRVSFLYTYSESRAVDLIRFLQTDKEQNFSSRIFTLLPTKVWNQTHPNNGSITTRLSYIFFFFFFRDPSRYDDRRKTKAISLV